MSNKPSVESVAALRSLLKRRNEIYDEMMALRAKIAQLEVLERDYVDLSREVMDALENMDCKTSGNTGWEARILWLLGQLERQASTWSSG